jgi:hypothetical protein
MKMPATKVIVFNAAAVLVAVTAVAAVMRSLLFAPSAAPCSERYHKSTVFALERSGVVLTAADLQSGLGGKDAGVIDNISIARVKDGPAPVAMTVSLPKGAASPSAEAGPKGGISFPWQPRVLQGKTAACLSYSVLFPADFQSGRGGTLPSINGADAGDQAPDSFMARVVWREGGRGGAMTRVTTGGEINNLPAERESFQLPRGRWVSLEEELVLNTPRQADGILRVWVDGKLAVDRTDIVYRTRSAVTITGVAVDVFYGFDAGSGTAPQDTKVSLTPLDVRWQ